MGERKYKNLPADLRAILDFAAKNMNLSYMDEDNLEVVDSLIGDFVEGKELKEETDESPILSVMDSIMKDLGI